MKASLITSLVALMGLIGGLASPIALAEESEAPEFLLGDLGVRIDLPGGWNMLRWSDWDFKAETHDQMVILFAWATPVRVEPVHDDLAAWAEVHSAKAEEIAGTDLLVDSTELVELNGAAIARSQITFHYDDLAMVLHGASLAVDGQMFHLATVSAKRKRSRSEASLDGILSALDVQSPPADITWGPTQEVDGITQVLPDTWREQHPKEATEVSRQITSLGIDDPEMCVTAIHPVANAAPDVMVTCQGGLWLGVVDELSFAEKDAELAGRIFGGAEVAPGEIIALTDRVGFIHDLALPGSTMLMASVPYDQGIARTWLVGQEDAGERLRADLSATLNATTYSGDHPVSVGDQVTYWLKYQPFHPVLLGGVSMILVVFGGSAFLVFRAGRGKSYEDMDLD